MRVTRKRARSVRTPKGLAGMEHIVFIAALDAAGIPRPKGEVQHIPGRKFALDYAWPDAKLGVEVEGGVYTGKAHGSISGILRDMEKNNLSILVGWRVLRFTPSQLCQPSTVETIQRALTYNPLNLR